MNCRICGKKELARGLCNGCYKATRYIPRGEEFPIKAGFKLRHRMLTHKEANAIDRCARRRGIPTAVNSRYTTVGGIRFY